MHKKAVSERRQTMCGTPLARAQIKAFVWARKEKWRERRETKVWRNFEMGLERSPGN